MKTVSHCYICGYKEVPLFKIINDYPIYHCEKCGLFWVPGVPGRAMVQYYSQEYFRLQGSKSGYRDYLAEELLHRKNSVNLLRIVSAYLPERAAGKLALLDVGCAYGFFLDEARKMSFDVRGVELSSDAAKYAVNKLQLDVRIGTLAEQCFKEDQFDAVFILGTLEHLTDPARELQEANRILKKDGAVVITTLDTKGKIPLFSWKPPEHLFYFNSMNTRMLLEKCFFTVLRTETYWVYYRLSDLAYRFAQYSSKPFFQGLNTMIAKTKLGQKMCMKIPTNEILLVARKSAP